MNILYAAILCLVSFSAGVQIHAYFRGDIRIFHQLDEGTDLNHGQVWLDVTFPHGVAFYYLKFPDGNYWPDDKKPRWVEILPDGRGKTWIDHIELEAGDQVSSEFQ
jgi:hypothetical protein